MNRWPLKAYAFPLRSVFITLCAVSLSSQPEQKHFADVVVNMLSSRIFVFTLINVSTVLFTVIHTVLLVFMRYATGTCDGVCPSTGASRLVTPCECMWAWMLA